MGSEAGATSAHDVILIRSGTGADAGVPGIARWMTGGISFPQMFAAAVRSAPSGAAA